MSPNDAPLDESTPDAMAGRVVGEKYELIRLIGQGGMGAVYEARNQATLKRLAVKLLTAPEWIQDEQMLQRFFREARAAAVVESDHVAQVFDCGIDARTDYPYMVMELLRGCDVEQALQRTGRLSEPLALRLIYQAALGLAKAHARHITHRDIKPANLFLSERDSGEVIVKVLDFGVAKISVDSLLRSAGHATTQSGVMLGTPLYMSPEQAKGADKVDARTDVWSLGVVLFELLTGRCPFADAQTLADLMGRLVYEPLPQIGEVRADVEESVQQLLGRAMVRDLEHRFADSAEFAAAIRPLLDDKTHLWREDLNLPDKLPAASAILAPPENIDQASSRRQGRASEAPATPEQDQFSGSTLDSGNYAEAGNKLSGNDPSGPTAVAESQAGVIVDKANSARASRLPLWVGLGAVGLLTLVGVVVTRDAERGDMTAAESPPSVLVEHTSAQQPVQEISVQESDVTSMPPRLELTLRVPVGAGITVDGEATPNHAGQVALRGKPGTAFLVKVQLGGQALEQRVVISDRGLVPEQLVLSPVSMKPAAVSGRTRSKNGGGERPAIAPSSKSSSASGRASMPPLMKGTVKNPKSGLGFSKDTSEFSE